MKLMLSVWSNISDPIIESFVGMYKGIAEMLPNVIAAVVILVVGYFIANVVRKALAVSLAKISFDTILENMGVAGVLKKVELKSSPSDVLAKLVFYIIMLFIIKNAADKLGVEDIAILVEKMIDFLPKVVISSVILLFGFIVAEVIQAVVRNGLESLNLDYARPLSNIIFGFIFVIVLTVALDQLEIQTELLNASVKIILGALGLAAAIALGVGLKGLAKSIVSGVYVRDIYKAGTEIEIDGELAKVAGVGPVTTKLISKDGGFIIIPNTELIEKQVKGQSAE